MTIDDSERAALTLRAQKQKPGPPFALTDVVRAIHFLRGVGSRACMALPAFYLFMGASDRDRRCSIEGYPGTVFLHSTEFSSCSTVTLCCRKVFDHARGMTGNSFSKIADTTLDDVATYWANSSGRPLEEAKSALRLLKEVFRQCAQAPSVLLDGDGTLLGKRVALLKQHADRVAAHLSLEDYAFSSMDLAHVVTAMSVIGEIVMSFDNASRGPQFFAELDSASREAAKQLFPAAPEESLFNGIQIAAYAKRCWTQEPAYGALLIIEHLPYATGWY